MSERYTASSRASTTDHSGLTGRGDLNLAAPDGLPLVTSSRGLLREEIYERIRMWIVDGHFPPGTKLRDKEIAESLSVSRTPVREAIRRLVDEGLVVAEASRWTKVAPVDVGEADRLYPIVWSLERLGIELGERWDADRVDALREINERMAEAIAGDDAVGASSADTDFHRALFDPAANPELAGILQDLKMRLRRHEIAYFDGSAASEPSVGEHEQVILALERGDFEAAGLAVVNNWRRSLDRLHTRLADRERET